MTIIRGIYMVRPTDLFDVSSCAVTDFYAFLATLARACAIAASHSDLVNQAPVQPNEHHALDLTCKRATAQVTNEVVER